MTFVVLAQMAVAPPDAAAIDERLLRGAKSAQARFERMRRMHLPRERGGGVSHRCDAHLGRFCYWYDSTDRVPVPEPAAIIAARRGLLGVLDSMAAAAPHDPWIAGQRVRYYMEAAQYDDALTAARSCGGDAWWCDALTGVVHHVAKRYAAADSAFTAALDAMPAEQRCEWLDLRSIADDRWGRSFRDASCEERERLADAVFTLGQPLWMVDGRDLRSEHLARLTMELVFRGSATPHGLHFGDDSRELLVRYGWPQWFTRREVTGAFASYSVTGHDREPSYYFLPNVARLRAGRIEASAWDLRANPAPSRYAPRHIERMAALTHQIARFPRGDSMLVVAALRRGDATLARDRFTTALAWWNGAEVRVAARGADTVLGGMVPADTTVISVELLGDSTMHAERARYTLEPLTCGAWCLSDLLIVDPARLGERATPIDAAGASLPDLRLEPGAPIGVYFELTQAAAGDGRAPGATFTLTVTPVRSSRIRRLATALRLADRRDEVRMRWQGVIRGEGQVVSLRLPERARGSYRVALTVAPAKGEPLTAEREVEIDR